MSSPIYTIFLGGSGEHLGYKFYPKQLKYLVIIPLDFTLEVVANLGLTSVPKR